MEPSDSAKRMAEMIHKAMEDHEISETEYNKIMMIADEDGVLDAQERSLLAELNQMIADKVVKRVAD